MPEVFVALSILILPLAMIFIYTYGIQLFSFSRFWLIFVTVIILIGTYFTIFNITYFLHEELTLFEKIFGTMGWYVMCIIVGFPMMYHNFLMNYYPKREINENVGKNCSNISEYISNHRKIIFIAYTYRVILFSTYASILSVLFARWYFQSGLQHHVVFFLSCITGLLAYLFFSCMAFLRLLIKCPNCESYVFYIDQNLEAFFIIAKRVVKERILDCVYCKATYALDPSLNLDELIDKKKAMLAEKKDPQQLYP